MACGCPAPTRPPPTWTSNQPTARRKTTATWKVMPFGNGRVKMRGLSESVPLLCLLIPAVMYGLGSEMRCSLQQFPGNYRALTSKPASWGAQSSCCCPQTRLPLRGLGVLETVRCHLRWVQLYFWLCDLSVTRPRCGAPASVCLDASWWICVRPCRIPNLKHMPATAGRVPLTRPSKVSPHCQLKVCFDKLSHGGPLRPPAISNPDLKFTKIWDLPPVLSKQCITLRRSG